MRGSGLPGGGAMDELGEVPVSPRCGRREMLKLGAGAAWLLLGAGPAGAARRAPQLHRWWPQFPVAREVWVAPFAGDVEEGMLLESAMGVVIEI